MRRVNRREFVRGAAGATILLAAPQLWFRTADAATREKNIGLDKRQFKDLADVAISTAKKLGASYCDLRVARYMNESIDTREERVEGVNSSVNSGFGVRVLLEGTWGFASSNVVTKEQIEKITRLAMEIAKANRAIQKKPVEIEKLPGYDDEWTMAMKRDPFSVSVEDKIKLLLAVNESAKKGGREFLQFEHEFRARRKVFRLYVWNVAAPGARAQLSSLSCHGGGQDHGSVRYAEKLRCAARQRLRICRGV